MGKNEANQPKEKTAKLVCIHCSATVDSNLSKLKSHLRDCHGITGLSIDKVCLHFVIDSPKAKKKEPQPSSNKNKTAQNSPAKQKPKQKKRNATEPKEKIIGPCKPKGKVFNNNEEMWARYNRKSTRDFHCGQVINGEPPLKVFFIPMGGANKRY